MDPDGHKACSFTNSGECIDITHLPYIPAGPLVNFAATAGFDDANGNYIAGSLETWSESEMAAIRTGALQTGRTLADFINANHPGWDVTSQQAFLMVHGGTLAFTKVGTSCGADPANSPGNTCGARTLGSRSVRVYTNADVVTNKEYWAVHELGHAFVSATGSRTPVNMLAEAIISNPLLGRGAEDEYAGFASTLEHPWLWQHSPVNSASEIFADMYLGAAYNSWEVSPLGQDRSNFMAGNIALWVDLALRE